MDRIRCACGRMRGEYDDHPGKCRACTGCNTVHRCDTCSKWPDSTWLRIERKRLARIEAHRNSPKSACSGSSIEQPTPAKKPCHSPSVPVSGPGVSAVTMITADVVSSLPATTVTVSSFTPISSVLPAAGFLHGLPGHGLDAVPALSLAPGAQGPVGLSGQVSWPVPPGPFAGAGPSWSDRRGRLGSVPGRL